MALKHTCHYFGINKSVFLMLVFFVGVFSPATLAAVSSPHSPTEIIVKFYPNTPIPDRHAILDAYGCSVTGSCVPGGFSRVRIGEGQEATETAMWLDGHERVDYAEVNPLVWAFFVPNDEFYSFQWNLQDGATGGINMEPAWDIHTGDPNVIVAVLDTGVAYEDFEDFTRAPDLAYTLFVPGYDFINDDEHPNDDQGHGTHVAGTIAQSTNNGAGVAGIAFGCAVMPVKVLDANGLGDHFAIASGIYFAVEQGAKVINLSLGAPGSSRTLYDAVAYAYHQGVTVVCSAGNEFFEGNPVIYPAAFDNYCIAVGASTYNLTRAFYSSTGSFVDVVAPGGDIFSDLNDDGFADGILQQTFQTDPGDFSYWFYQGTSMAAPHVSGAAALLISHGVTEPNRVREAIEQTAIDLGRPGVDSAFGWGLLDVGAAMLYEGVNDRLGGDIPF